jgi:hypothetical protein
LFFRSFLLFVVTTGPGRHGAAGLGVYEQKLVNDKHLTDNKLLDNIDRVLHATPIGLSTRAQNCGGTENEMHRSLIEVEIYARS